MLKPSFTEELKVPISKMAALHLRSKAEWLSCQRHERCKDNSRGNDHKCAYFVLLFGDGDSGSLEATFDLQARTDISCKTAYYCQCIPAVVDS